MGKVGYKFFFFCIFVYFLNKTFCWAKGLGVIMEGQQVAPCAIPPRCQSLQGYKVHGGGGL